MRSLKARVSNLEKREPHGKGLKPYTIETKDSWVDVKITPCKGWPPVVWINYDSLTLNAEEAVDAILPRLPPACTLRVMPRTLSLEEWMACSAPQGETPTLH